MEILSKSLTSFVKMVSGYINIILFLNHFFTLRIDSFVKIIFFCNFSMLLLIGSLMDTFRTCFYFLRNKKFIYKAVL